VSNAKDGSQARTTSAMGVGVNESAILFVMNEELAQAIAKTVRDFVHYFGTVDHPKLETWIEDTLKQQGIGS
jgi:hypothetical protein